MRLTITPTMASTGGRIVLSETESVPAHGAMPTARCRRTSPPRATGSTAWSSKGRAASASRRRRSTPWTCCRDQAPTVTLSKPGPRHRRHARAGVLRRGAGRRRLRGEEPAAGVLGERRARDSGAPVRRRAAGAGGHRRAHLLSGRAGREGRRLGVVLRAGPPTTTRWTAPSRPRATSSSCAFARSARTSSRPRRWAAGVGAVAAGAAATWARSHSSSARSSRAPSTCSAIARR